MASTPHVILHLGLGSFHRAHQAVYLPGRQSGDHGVSVDELHRRLLEFGFVEGARIEVLHEGAIWRDPIAVRLDDMRIGLRRRDAADVWIQLDAE